MVATRRKREVDGSSSEEEENPKDADFTTQDDGGDDEEVVAESSDDDDEQAGDGWLYAAALADAQKSPPGKFAKLAIFATPTKSPCSTRARPPSTSCTRVACT